MYGRHLDTALMRYLLVLACYTASPSCENLFLPEVQSSCAVSANTNTPPQLSG